MSEVEWTKEQKQAIEENGENILVAAAAGSGKTAVLVERIIEKIIKNKIDVDKILVVTFTNAAASEMRERILKAIYKKIEEHPNNAHLQKQVILLNRANISTIHAFCLEVIKNNFYEIDISPNFRIGDTAEMELLKQDSIDEVFDELYEKQESGFLKLVNDYAGYRGDEELKNTVLRIYQYMQSTPFPQKWLHEKTEIFNVDTNQDFAKTIWGQILTKELAENLIQAIDQLKYIYRKMDLFYELEKFKIVIGDDINIYKGLLESVNNWDELYKKANLINYLKWPVDKKIVSELKTEAKQIRDNAKKQVFSCIGKTLLYDSKDTFMDISSVYGVLKEFEKIINLFDEKFTSMKREKNCVDFNDIEHLALKILVKEENGEYVQTEVAKKYQEKFEEIAVDEYQDSNLVQEYILTTISRKNNIFMVGDVKQSIYKFRQARPELFLDKYEKYSLIEDKKENDNVKIQLFQNFRSRSNILNLTNLVFDSIMTKKLGDIEYNEKEYLRQKNDYEAPNKNILNFGGKAELSIIDLAKDDLDEDNEGEELEKIENTELEAKYVAKKIKDFLNSDYYVYDKNIKTYRKVTYKDIVILLRATSASAPIFEKAISDLEMPVFSDTSSEYLNAIEIQTIISVLKILDNPLQDIPLVSVLRSYIGGFTDNELIKIRLLNKNSYFYEALEMAKNSEDLNLKKKVDRFFKYLNKWKDETKYLGLEELIWNIFMDSGYYHYVSLMPDGNLKIANLKMLLERAKQYEEASFKGLFNFIHFIDKLKNSSGDLGSAKIIGENENVIRIMSIHKSKGLEFPIVFLCGMGKQFNLRDLNEKLLIHHELGFGPRLIDAEKGIEYNTLAKEAIRIQAKKETISEEMRILYVALTRSKEKLFLIGIDKNYENTIKTMNQLVEMYGSLNESLLQKYISYLNWFELISIARKRELEELLDISIVKGKDFMRQNQVKENAKENFADVLNKKSYFDKDIEKLLKWKYAYIPETKILSKTSVTQVVREYEEKNENIEEVFETPLPMFLKQNNRLSSSQRGTQVHLFLQKLDFRKNYTKKELEEEIDNLIAKDVLLPNSKYDIPIDKIEKFMNSSLAEEIRNAKQIKKETPFYINLSAKEALLGETEDNVLVQGIIDLYFIKQNGDVVLVDYKTDFVKEESDLVEKYKNQLNLYKRALEDALEKEVHDVYLYSIYLGKAIKI